MRAITIAVASLLTMTLLPIAAPSVEAANPAAPFVYVSQMPGQNTEATVFVGSSDGDTWNCTTNDASSGNAVDITVSCTGNNLPNFYGRCSGARIGAQGGTGYPVGSTVMRLLAPVIAPPPAVSNPLGASTWLSLDASCGSGTGSSAGIGFMTPGADALQYNTAPAQSFTCRFQVVDGQAAAPWNGFCYGLP